jgi:predicted amino acid racemase
MSTPRIEIDLSSIAHNVRVLVERFGAKGIHIVGVTKAVCGDPKIANIFFANGIKTIGDSRLENLKRMREAGITAPLLLLRLPAITEAEEVVNLAEYSLNSEILTIRHLSEAAHRNGRTHKVILMVELGDLREGIMPEDLNTIVRQVIDYKGIALAGIGGNLFCYGGVQPDDDNMGQLSALAHEVETEFGIELEVVSGGSTINYMWVMSAEDVGRINQLRCGESLLVGGITLEIKGIPGLKYEAFKLVTEVIESKVKPSLPWGEIGLDGLGQKPSIEDRGPMQRIIVNIGRQDIFPLAYSPILEMEILGAGSDHLVLDAKQTGVNVGEEVAFILDYNPIMQVMNSQFVQKVYLNEEQALRGE